MKSTIAVCPDDRAAVLVKELSRDFSEETNFYVLTGRCTLEPHVPEAAALRAWWATREGEYAPNVPLPSLVAIDAVPSLAKGTLVRVVALVTDMGDVASKWNEAKAAETLRRTLTIADESHRSIELTVFDWDEQTDASLGGIISVKARTDDFMGVPQLKASSKDVDFAASIPEAHALHAHWLRESPEVTPLLRTRSSTSTWSKHVLCCS